MDRIAVVYYSLDGHTHFVVEKIKERLACTVIRLRLQKEFSTEHTFLKYFWAGKSSVFHEKPVLKNPKMDLDSYDTLIIATPVWAGNLSSPVRSFLASRSFDGKRVFLVATNSGGSFKKCFATMEKLLPTATIIRETGFINITEATYPSQQQQLEDLCAEVVEES